MAASADVTRRDRLAALILVAVLVAGASALIVRRALREHDLEPGATLGSARQAVLFDRFTARRERGDDGERLSVSLRLRTSADVSLPCFVFVVARNDQTSPRLWAIWPAQPPGPAITASGHFHGAAPSAGSPVTLSDTWTRVRATIPSPAAGVAFDSVAVYVVDPSGRIVLARPFRL